jgi:2-oxoglutarate dehydrogenase E2 component (dihydrolipoamide succinyltransferase)
MSEEFKVTLPKLGESILSATIVQWFKKVGDPVKLDEPLLEVSTDKVNSEIPSPVAGYVKEILAQPDDELQVGELLAVISQEASMRQEAAAPAPIAKSAGEKSDKAPSSEFKDFFSPALLRLAREKGISLDELQKIGGTGEGGRITKKDLESYIEKPKAPAASTAPKPTCPKAVAQPTGDIERVKMSGMRKAIADNMVRSFYEAPHASLITEVDVTGVLKLIQKEKEGFFARHGVKLTITSFVARAMIKALQEFPLLNSSLDDDTIVVKRFVNVGIAVSVEQGIMVPVIKHCQRMNLAAIAKALGEVSEKARSNRLSPDDVTDGTITLTNFGMSGVAIGIPIIRYPEVAIVGIGATQKKVVALDDETFGVRSMMHISLTFDHRVLDGMYGCGFLNSLKKHLEEDLRIE